MIGSQWFAFPRHIIQWLLQDSLPIKFIQYAKHIVVADEIYFTTMFRNSPFCLDLTSSNLLFSHFDVWEHEKGDAKDERKCLSIDPDFCGRSPTILTAKDWNWIKISNGLFGRKFNRSTESMKLLDWIDQNRINSFSIDKVNTTKLIMMSKLVPANNSILCDKPDNNFCEIHSFCWEMMNGPLHQIKMISCMETSPAQQFIQGER
jgi:hypothetical protein